MIILRILLGALLLLQSQFTFSNPSGEILMRGLLVGGLYDIVSDSTKTQEFLAFIKKYGFTELVFYTGGPVETRVIPLKQPELKTLIDNVRAQGVTFVSLAVGGTSEMDRVSNFISTYSVKINGLWLEYEWWNNSPRDFFTNATNILKYMRSKAPAGTVIGAYIGWTTQDEMTALIKLVDRVYMHSYVDKGSKLYPKTQSRLDQIKTAVPSTKVKVLPIISAEWLPPEICNQGPTAPGYYDNMCFLGPWLKANNAFDGAELAYNTAEKADRPKSVTTKTWRNYATLTGFYYYSYNHCKDALK